LVTLNININKYKKFWMGGARGSGLKQGSIERSKTCFGDVAKSS
jgi:hypothetical protein